MPQKQARTVQILQYCTGCFALIKVELWIVFERLIAKRLIEHINMSDFSESMVVFDECTLISYCPTYKYTYTHSTSLHISQKRTVVCTLHSVLQNRLACQGE